VCLVVLPVTFSPGLPEWRHRFCILITSDTKLDLHTNYFRRQSLRTNYFRRQMGGGVSLLICCLYFIAIGVWLFCKVFRYLVGKPYCLLTELNCALIHPTWSVLVEKWKAWLARLEYFNT
jgi:hypothetical protein